MIRAIPLGEVGRIPLPGDNVAIAVRRLEAGTEIISGNNTLSLDYTVLEGHRFTILPVVRGESLMSWGLPFGVATLDLKPGSYVCNPGMLEALAQRTITVKLPSQPNFVDDIEPYDLSSRSFKPSRQVPMYTQQRTFLGFQRPAARGIGTRNYVVLLAISSLTSSYVRQLARRFEDVAPHYPNLDGVVHIEHSEGGISTPNNLTYILRVLAGYIVHPNVGAVLIVDSVDGGLTHGILKHFMQVNGYPLGNVLHHFLSLDSHFERALDSGEAIVRGWLEVVDHAPRTPQPSSGLSLALQCGGSDAFSGISGNPLISLVAREIIRFGGSAVIAETAELIGAEAYMLQRVKDLRTAEAFLAMIGSIKERATWHGGTVEGNVSGGNRVRGLYNIVLKSIGAARKRHPDVCLNTVLDYAELVREPGFVFMNSPGMDLESIAGQVASGSNMILFVTGSGSITNFPFVPTIKIVTTSERYRQLADEMDVNAGEYLDGTSMDELAGRTLELVWNVASGERSKGELADHYQVQLWRDWPIRDKLGLASIVARPCPRGIGIPVASDVDFSGVRFTGFRTPNGIAPKQVGLILPVSLCSGQIAEVAKERLNKKDLGLGSNLSGFVSLPHTEGCATSGFGLEELLIRTLLGYATHPMVRHCLFLEHGCEDNHNDGLRKRLEQAGFDPDDFGWANIQQDGGMEKVLNKIEHWFARALSSIAPMKQQIVGFDQLRLGLLTSGQLSQPVIEGLARFVGGIVASGSVVVIPERDELLKVDPLERWIQDADIHHPTVEYGEHIASPGLHIMHAPSAHWVETHTGLGATGVQILLAYVADSLKQAHPMIPMLQVTSEHVEWKEDADLLLEGDPSHWCDDLLCLLTQTLSSDYSPRSLAMGNVDFQITRGLAGLSL